jgi:hypothetical protein
VSAPRGPHRDVRDGDENVAARTRKLKLPGRCASPQFLLSPELLRNKIQPAGKGVSGANRNFSG